MVIDDRSLQALREESWEFRALELRHQQLEEELTMLMRHRALTPAEELHKKELQKHKLLIKDRMTDLIRESQRTARLPRRSRPASRGPAPGAA